MVRPSSSHPPPSDPAGRDLADADGPENESTAVRPKLEPAPVVRRRYQSGVWQTAGEHTPRDRVEHKLRAASALLASLPPNHPRVRLLRIAIVRRDEVVLDGILHDLHINPPR